MQKKKLKISVSEPKTCRLIHYRDVSFNNHALNKAWGCFIPIEEFKLEF